jgi:hypothetical protein
MPTWDPRHKVFVDLACSSHNAMWEKNHTLLFRASLEWLTQGTVNGDKRGNAPPWILSVSRVREENTEDSEETGSHRGTKNGGI